LSELFSAPIPYEPVQTLANHIEHELQHGLWQNCAIYEDELQRLWPLETSYRELRIADFAVRYGFRLRFYQKGVCAIFEKQPRSNQRALSFRSCAAMKSWLHFWNCKGRYTSSRWVWSRNDCANHRLKWPRARGLGDCIADLVTCRAGDTLHKN